VNEISALTARVEALERRWRSTVALAGVLALGLLAVTIASCVRDPRDILKVRGIVITDAAGNDRIVLGAPIGDVSDDPRLVQTVGAVVLDESDRLNVAVGANTPLVYSDGSVGTRVADNAGITIYDPRNGGERGGFSAFSDGRVNVCLDYEKPKEAACVVVGSGDAYTAVLLNGTPNDSLFDRVGMFLGEDGSGVIKVLGGDASPGGLLLQAGTGRARLVRIDAEGREAGEIE